MLLTKGGCLAGNGNLLERVHALTHYIAMVQLSSVPIVNEFKVVENHYKHTFLLHNYELTCMYTFQQGLREKVNLDEGNDTENNSSGRVLSENGRFRTF